MADYGIFGHGSSGNSWFANKLDDFHASTKKYDPLGHYAVEWPMKGAHWLVEKSSKGLADAGIAPGFNTRLNQEADENGSNFGLGSQRMGLGILSVLGGMYGLSGEAAGAAGSAGGGGGAAASGGAPTALGYGLGGTAGYTLPGSGGAAAGGAAGGLGSGLYMEQGGGMVADSGGGGFNWLNSDGTSGSTGLLGQGGSSGGLMQQLMQQGGSGGQQQAQGQQGGRPGGTMLGNPALTAALSKLVSDNERKKEGGINPYTVAQSQGRDTSFEDFLRMMQEAQQNYGGENGRTT